jgi:hypothetical protein
LSLSICRLQPRLALRVEWRPRPGGSLRSCGEEEGVLARESQPQCALCERLLFAALAASRLYHDPLGDLEAWHIRQDEQRAFRLRKEVAEALFDRDAAIAGLAEHERTHAKTSAKGKKANP